VDDLSDVGINLCFNVVVLPDVTVKIYFHSLQINRRSRPLTRVNCGALWH
jgi:hypothetical protein